MYFYTTALTFFILRLFADCFSRMYILLYTQINKLTRTFISKDILFQFISFYSIFNLRLRTTVRRVPSRDSLPILTHYSFTVKHFSRLFQSFFKLFSTAIFLCFFGRSLRVLAYITTLICLCQQFFKL